MKNGHPYQYRTWIQVSKPAIANNYRIFRKLAGRKTLLMGVVKSNAYGHEIYGFAKQLANLGIDWLGVDSISEAVSLRESGIKTPILVLGYTLPENYVLAAKYNITLTISTLENLALATQTKPKHNKLKIFLKIDSGMHRQGIFPDQFAKACSLANKNIIVQGIYTHFAAAKDPKSPGDTLKQFSAFKTIFSTAKKHFPNAILSASATGGAINFPETRLDMIRVGIGLYGLWPSEPTHQAYQKKLKLLPALRWQSVISETKLVKKGAGIGYNFTAKGKTNTKIAIIPIGYWHGYPRSLSNKSYVIIRGKKAPVIGNVSMDIMACDITKIPDAKPGDVITLIGQSGKENISAEQLAKYAGTIGYEIITRLNPLIKHYFI